MSANNFGLSLDVLRKQPLFSGLNEMELSAYSVSDGRTMTIKGD